MMDKNVIGVLITYLFFSILFPKQNVLWDLGVIINSIDHKPFLDNSNFKSASKGDNNVGFSANISDPFIDPIMNFNTLNEGGPPKNDREIIHNILITNENILEIDLEIKRLFFSKQYNKIVEVFQNNNLENISKQDRQNIKYYLANSLYQIGDYDNAIKLVISLDKTEENYVLLSMVYEAMGNKKLAIKNYINLIKLYPNSEYIKSAKIKIRMLNKQL